MKNKRQLLKQITKDLILETTKQLIVENGVLKTTTKEISISCKVAHGTIFSHFENRDKLISVVVKNELMEIAKKLYKIKETDFTLEELLTHYLNFVEENEDFLVVVYKEFSFLNKNLQREIITTESIVKNIFYNKIEKNIRHKDLKPQIILSTLFGTINYYLSRKEYFVSSGSVIAEKKNDIINTFINLIKT